MPEPRVYRARRPDGVAIAIRVENARIAAVTPLGAAAAEPGAAPLPYALPVLVDWQINGALGVYFNTLADPAAAGPALRAIADHLRRHGVGCILPTLTTNAYPRQLAACAAMAAVLDADADLAALCPGLFHEGLFISPEDGWRGAHNRDWLLPPDYTKLQELDAASGGRIRLVNIAPELPGGIAFIARCVADGRRVALGHCCPDADTVAAAVDAGATLVTHFGNGAAPTLHRFRNPFWSFLARPELSFGLICDGFHLPRDLVLAAVAAKGWERCLPVSDASGYAGMPPGDYVAPELGGRRFTIEPSGFLHLSGSEILSGAWYLQDRSVAWLVREIGLDFLHAWRQCSQVPAAALGLDLPRLEPGAEASFVLADWDAAADDLRIHASVHRGVAYPGSLPADPANPVVGNHA